MVTGAIYSIMASGLVLTYQTSGVFNFAHAAVAFTSAYFYFQINTGQGVPILPSIIITVVFFAPLLGLALDRIVLGRLSTAPMYARIVGTIGLLVALPNLAQWLVNSVAVDWLGLHLAKLSDFGADVGFQPPGVGPTPAKVYRLSWLGLDNVNLNSDQLAVFVVAAIVAVLLYLVLRRTRVGLEMRAQVDRDSLAALRGVNPRRTSGVAWMLSMTLPGSVAGSSPRCSSCRTTPTCSSCSHRSPRSPLPACGRFRSRSPPASPSVSWRTSSPATSTSGCRTSSARCRAWTPRCRTSSCSSRS